MDNLNEQTEATGTSSEDGTTTVNSDNWRDYIPEDLKDKGYWKPLANADLTTVLKTLGHSQERLGKSITLPGDDAKPEDFHDIYTKLGKPASKDEYKVEEPSVEGYNWGEESFNAFKEAAFNANMTQEQTAAVVDWFRDDLKSKVGEAQDKGLETTAIVETKLKKEYGPDYDMSIALAKRASHLYYGPDATEAWFDTMPEPVIRGMVKLGKQMAEDKVFGNSPPEMNGVTSKEAAIKRIADIGGDRSHPYWQTQESPAKEAAIKEMADLHTIAFPEG
jgi:hypothetical protein